MPALACNGTTMIQIGVFAHEFGHAFGLPDLYDTDDSNGDSEGVGNWCLMAGGSWGGDGNTPERPTHMSAWSKEFLGWVTPKAVTADTKPATLPSVRTRQSLKVSISSTQYYLVENRQQKLFDQNLPTGGVAIWRINDSVDSGRNNTVNGREQQVRRPQEADCSRLQQRHRETWRPFPGSAGRRADNAESEDVGNVAICSIGASGDPMTANVLVSTGKCGNGNDNGICSSLATTKTPGTGGVSGLLLALPLLTALYLARRRRSPVGVR
jgi:hypothetical protein